MYFWGNREEKGRPIDDLRDGRGMRTIIYERDQKDGEMNHIPFFFIVCILNLACIIPTDTGLR